MLSKNEARVNGQRVGRTYECVHSRYLLPIFEWNKIPWPNSSRSRFDMTRIVCGRHGWFLIISVSKTKYGCTIKRKRMNRETYHVDDIGTI